MFGLRKTNAPEEMGSQSAVSAVSYVFKYSANYLRGDQAALGAFPLEIKCKYFTTVFSEVINKRAGLLRRMHLNCGVILAGKLYLGNNFQEWDTGFATCRGKLSLLNLTVILLPPLKPEEPRVVNMTETKTKKDQSRAAALPSWEHARK